MVHDVKLWSSMKPLAGGADSVEIEARTVGALIERLVEKHPGLEPVAAQGIAVSIDGVIYQHSHDRPIPEGAEIYLLPRLKGG